MAAADDDGAPPDVQGAMGANDDGDTVMQASQPIPEHAGSGRSFTSAGLARVMQAAAAGVWPAAADVVDALTGAAACMRDEGKVVAARPGRTQPLHIFGALGGSPDDVLGAVRAAPDPEAVRWLFLGDYAGPGARGLCSLALVAALKCVAPRAVRLLRGGRERTESAPMRALRVEMECHYGAVDTARIVGAAQNAFQSMPWVARLRGASIATPSAFTCVEGADTTLSKIGTGDAAARDHQWAALALSAVATPQARTRQQDGGGWIISREELALGLRRAGKQLLVRTGTPDEAGVITLGGRQRAATVPPGRFFTDSWGMPEPHTLPLDAGFDDFVPSFRPDRMLTADKSVPGTVAGVTSGSCEVCGAKYPAAASRRGDVAVARSHVQRCRTIFVEEWRARDAQSGSPPAGCTDGLQAMLTAIREAGAAESGVPGDALRGAGAATGGAADGEASGDPAMDVQPDPDVERADALCGEGGGADHGVEEDAHLPRVDIRHHLQQLDGVDVIRELMHRVPTLRRVPWRLRPLVRQAFVSALVLARPEEHPARVMSNGEKLSRLVVRMVLALPPRPETPDANETPEAREQRTARERRELHEHVRGRLHRFATGDWLALLADARAAWPAQRSVRGVEDDADDVGGEAQRAEMANRACEAARDGRIARARQ
eukprot:gene10513-4764_t